MASFVMKLCSRGPASQLLKHAMRSMRPAFRVNRACMTTFVPDNYQRMYTLQSWGHEVHPYGKLIISVPFNVKVVPLDEDECPFMDKAFITLYADTEKHHMMEDIMEWNRFYNCRIDIKDHEREVDFLGLITPEGHEHFQGIVPLDCLVQVPIKFGLSLHMSEEGNIDVEEMESHDINITTQNGDCILRSIKSGSIHVHSMSGNITCRSAVQANMELKTGNDGKIKADKLQGQHIKVRTENGDIKAQSIYTDDANFWSQEGEIRLGSCHGNIVCDVREGNIFCDTLDGNLQASINKGYFEGHVSRIQDKVSVKNEKGNIRLQVPDTLDASLDLTGTTVNIDTGLVVYDAEEHDTAGSRRRHLGKLNGGSKHPIVADTSKGSVVMESVNWFDTLKLTK